MQRFTEDFFELEKAEQRRRNLELDQNVDIAVGTLFFTGVRTEQSDSRDLAGSSAGPAHEGRGIPVQFLPADGLTKMDHYPL